MNIFEISKEIQSVFEELEDNGGELTPELEEKLSISQDEFRLKVESYLSVIKTIESDIECCDKEIKRLQSVKKAKQNSIERLKRVLIWAIDTFGDINKSGNRFIDLGTTKITIKSSDKVVVNEEYVTDIINNLFEELRQANFTKEIYNNDIKDLVTPSNNKLEGIMATVLVDIPIDDIYDNKSDSFIKSLFTYSAGFKVKPNISKSLIKANLNESPDFYMNIAHMEQGKSLLIK